ncbi:hypothetical protein BJF79_13920 [Actinomadura sp. CNU-125]|uniref:hypothetical protein n=1 Tax=Actinomadura sp. CNU-125 TaxID=1904961 RepID=UPI00095BC3A4|nr:hypothetical protein [Actinomadura sp. CNU-125]OLT24054.1 hypothetical protein BJF79_13920 [Actinomadura sp. CNU-125]
MPSMPAALMSGAQKLAGRYAAVIDENRRISAHFVLLRCRDTQHDPARHVPGDHIGVRVSDRDFRRYTVLDTHPTGYSVLVDLVPDGPGARWARDVRPGARIVAPPSGRPLRPRSGSRHLVLGGATAIAAAHALTTAITAAGGTAVQAVEVPASELAALADLVPDADLVPSASAPGTALEERLPALLDRGPFDHVYLIGHAASLQRLRTAVRAATAMSRRSIHTQVHWADGRRGL